MKEIEKTFTMYIADDGSEHPSQEACLEHEAIVGRRDLRAEFAREHTKTERSLKTLKRLLESYDRFCAIHSATPQRLTAEKVSERDAA